MTALDVDIVLPVHNEAIRIEATIRELYAEIGARLTVRLIVCEDGSVDDTVGVVTGLATHYPITLITSTARKGYSRAVIDGMKASTAPYVLAVDGDGQCDPTDFWALWELRRECDLVTGHRQPRRDPWFRRAFSGAFRLAFRLLLGLRAKDPSCPYVLASRAAVARLVPSLGTFEQGLWWEVTARASLSGLRTREVPIHHRRRASGTTQVYQWRSLPRIGLSHARALLALWRETRA